jgi:alkaline phosphatase D
MRARLDRSGQRREGLTRRAMLRGSAMALLAGACGDNRGRGAGGQDDPLPMDRPGPSPGDLSEAPLSTFPLGVASGDVRTDQVSVWAQYRGTAELFAAVWEMIDESYGDLIAWTRVSVGSGGFVQVDLDGLTPELAHSFAFVEVHGGEPGSRSALGRFLTAPALETLAPLRFGASCCTKQGFSLAPIEQAGSREDLAFFALLGDTTYNAGARTIDDFRQRWGQNLSSAGYRSLRQSTSVLATWDDHEVINNWDPETIDEALLTKASEAFFEHLPVRRHPQRRSQIYRSTRWGSTAEVFVLDTRSERRPSTRLREDAQYLSRAQMDWLKNGLAASPCTFKVILNSVPITNFPLLFDVVAIDRWEGYAAARREILSFIENERIGGVLWLSGDFHFGSAGRVSPAGEVGSQAIEVLVGPAAQDPNPLWATLVDTAQFDFATGTNNTTVFDLDPSARTATVTFHDDEGTVLATRSYGL